MVCYHLLLFLCLSERMSEETSSPPSDSKISKHVARYQRFEDSAKSLYRKAIMKLHARDFLAEFLGTFVLVVRYHTHTCMHIDGRILHMYICKS